MDGSDKHSSLQHSCIYFNGKKFYLILNVPRLKFLKLFNNCQHIAIPRNKVYSVKGRALMRVMY